jgi:hypothetical protein
VRWGEGSAQMLQRVLPFGRLAFDTTSYPSFCLTHSRSTDTQTAGVNYIFKRALLDPRSTPPLPRTSPLST